jgi:hypothetical protein
MQSPVATHPSQPDELPFSSDEAFFLRLGRARFRSDFVAILRAYPFDSSRTPAALQAHWQAMSGGIHDEARPLRKSPAVSPLSARAQQQPAAEQARLERARTKHARIMHLPPVRPSTRALLSDEHDFNPRFDTPLLERGSKPDEDGRARDEPACGEAHGGRVSTTPSLAQAFDFSHWDSRAAAVVQAPSPSFTKRLLAALGCPGRDAALDKHKAMERALLCDTIDALQAALPELELAAAQAPLAPLPLEQQEAVARLGAQFWGKWNSNAEPVPAKARELVLKLIKSV